MMEGETQFCTSLCIYCMTEVLFQHLHQKSVALERESCAGDSDLVDSRHHLSSLNLAIDMSRYFFSWVNNAPWFGLTDMGWGVLTRVRRAGVSRAISTVTCTNPFSGVFSNVHSLDNYCFFLRCMDFLQQGLPRCNLFLWQKFEFFGISVLMNSRKEMTYSITNSLLIYAQESHQFDWM
jgi:hypothetical protein